MIIDFNLFQSNVAFRYPLEALEHLIFALGIEMELSVLFYQLLLHRLKHLNLIFLNVQLAFIERVNVQMF